MKGTYRIVVQNKRIKYDFVIRRNITIIKGDSATGKTTLVDMIQEYYENSELSGIQLQCDRECVPLYGRNWKSVLNNISDSIVFIDEGNEFVLSAEFASVIKDTNNYYVIVNREGIPTLPYSVEEVYGIKNSGKYGTLKQVYNEFYHIYSKSDYKDMVKTNFIIVEDSNSGYQFFNEIVSNKEVSCISAHGKSNVFKTMIDNCNYKKEEILVIADGAAFGSEIEKIIDLMKIYKNIKLYLPESFEWLILKSGVVDRNNIMQILLNPYDYIESKNYFSWERFFTSLLIESTEGTYLKYSKKTLNKVYISEKISKKIIETMRNIDLEK